MDYSSTPLALPVEIRVRPRTSAARVRTVLACVGVLLLVVTLAVWGLQLPGGIFRLS